MCGIERWLARLPLIALGGLWLIIAILPGVAGWFIANRLWDNGLVGALTPYALLVLLYALIQFLGEITETVVAFVAFVPVIYALVLIVQVLLLSFRLSSYPDLGNFLTRNLDGVLYGAAVAAILMLKTSRGDFGDLFLAALSFRLPLAFMIAGLADVPDAPLARILLGSSWGIVFAASAAVFTSQVDEEPVKEARAQIVFVEMALLSLLFIGTFGELSKDNEIRRLVLQTLPAAAIACAGTYLLVLVGAAIRKQ